MTWLWRTFFSLILLAPLPAATLSARVELVDSREPSVRKLKDYSGVVVWLEPVGRPMPAPAPKTFTMAQKGKKFLPHILAIPVGSSVDFPNQDLIFHNAFSNFAGQPFDTGLYAPNTSKKITFRRDGVVRLFCNIHSQMSAVILVLRSPWFAVSKPSGELQISDLPSGDYILKIWHERAGDETLQKLERRVTLNSSLELPVIRISESGYLEVPHKNKHGQDYPPEPPGATYPGGRK